MDKSKMRSALASGKGKKILPIVVCLVVAIGGYAILSGGNNDAAPAEAPPMTAQQAMAAARAKLAHEGKVVPPAPSRSPSVAAVSVPAPASSVASVVAAASVPSPATSAALAATTSTASAPADSKPVNPALEVAASAASSPSVPAAVAVAAPIASVAKPDAAPAPASAPDFTAGWRRNDVLASLEWQARVLELKAKIASLQRQVDGTDVASGPAPATPAVVMPPPTTLHSDNQLVSSLEIPLQAPTPRGSQLESVMMVGGKYQAIVSAHGASLAVGEGVRLADGWIVQDIDATSVRLVRGREHKTLRIGG
jgi:hypothetical protein